MTKAINTNWNNVKLTLERDKRIQALSANKVLKSSVGIISHIKATKKPIAI